MDQNNDTTVYVKADLKNYNRILSYLASVWTGHADDHIRTQLASIIG